MRADQAVVPTDTLKPGERPGLRVGGKYGAGILRQAGEPAAGEYHPGEYRKPTARLGRPRPGSVWFMLPPPLHGIIHIWETPVIYTYIGSPVAL